MDSQRETGPGPRETGDGATVSGASRHERTTPEFGRVANLSDGVFAIAMTLLVLTLDAPRVGTSGLAAALIEQFPQLLAFILAFALVANLWWQHHKLVALFDVMEPGIVGLNLVLLGAVALVPFPTSLVGNAPTDRAAVLAFIAVFSVLSLLFLLLVVRARQVGAWREGVSEQHVHWMLGQWGWVRHRGAADRRAGGDVAARGGSERSCPHHDPGAHRRPPRHRGEPAGPSRRHMIRGRPATPRGAPAVASPARAARRSPRG